jgi:hypothetical protein
MQLKPINLITLGQAKNDNIIAIILKKQLFNNLLQMRSNHAHISILEIKKDAYWLPTAVVTVALQKVLALGEGRQALISVLP